jgi:outer membrane protein assembly factor BamB
MGAYDKLLTLGPILGSPVVAGNVVYVGSVDGNLYALE